MLKNKVRRGYTLSIATGTIILAFIFLSGIAAAQGTTWHILAGGETPDMALQGMGFYPRVITINEGDTINWTLGGNLVHTVSFLSGTPAPDPESPEAAGPAGGSTYNGTGFVSSGIITPGMSYSLNFTKPGVYTYQCLIHPGMGGVVVVQPADSSYPFTQEQYTAKGQQELQLDLDAGKQELENLSLTSMPGPDGTTIWQVAADIPLPETTNVLLSPQNNSSVSGNATLNFTGAGMLQVNVELSGLAPNSVHPAHIHAGTCADGGPIAYPLMNDLVADSEGNVTNKTLISGPPWLAVLSRGWFVNVHQGPTMSGSGAASISCGDVVKPAVALMRFVPENITVRTGDSVIWTQLNPMEIHTVTFLAAGQEEPPFPSPEAAAPAGGNVHNGTGFYNSGIMKLGQNYTLKFTKLGTYDYLCIIHDNLGMVGRVEVQPVTTPNVTRTPQITATPGVTRTPGVTATPRVTQTPIGPPTSIPEFPSVVLPVSAVLGLIAFLLYRRRE